MFRYLIIASIALLASARASAQSKVNWTGKVVDSTTKEILELATVAVNDAKDSTLYTYTLTDKKGQFKLDPLPSGQTFVLLVSYTGYKQYRKVLKADADHDFGAIILAPSSRALNEVVIEGEKPPISIKNDTLEFNASSFKTKPNAVVEDLLKKLPGVEVEEDGSIKVNGKTVSRILVDGKEFFGNDPKIATKNLPKEIVDKIQVVDTKTKVQEITGQKTDGQDKTINITLKEDKKKGVFGRITGGIGTQERYDASALVNFFNKKRQISIIGALNNLNNTGFTFSDLQGIQSGGGGRGGMSVTVGGGMMGGGAGPGMISMNGLTIGGVGGEGIRKIATGGVNYNEQINRKLQVNGSYFYNYADTRIQTSRHREFTNTDTANVYDEDRTGVAYNNNHRMNMSFNYQIDSFTTLIVAPNLDYSATSSLSETHGITRTPDGDMVNSSDMFNRSAMNNLNFRNNFSLVRLLNRKGRSISMEFGQQYSRNEGNLFVNSENHFVEDGVDREELTDQHTRSNGDTRGLSGSLTYIEPLGKDWRMEASYNFNYALSNSDRQTYNLNSGTGKYEDIDSAYSNKFRSVNVMQKPQLVFNYNTQKFNVALGGGIQMNTLKNYSYTQDDSINLYQTSFVPTSRISYNVSQQLRVSADYYFYANQPTTDQLQPVPDNTNTLFKRVGNPDLKTAFNHNINLRMDGFVPQKGFNYSVNIGYSPIANAIVNEVSYDKNFVQTTRPINVSGNYNINTFSYISKSIKKKNYSWRFNGNLNANYGQSLSFSSRPETGMQRNETKTTSVGGNGNVTYVYKELFDIAPGYRINYRKTDYSISTMRSTDATVHSGTLSTALYWPKKFVWENDINYSYNTNMAPGYRKDVTLWNMAVSRMFLKNDRGMLKLSVYDLLNRNISSRRLIQQDYIEDVQTMIVQQYFMLSFTYNISSFGGGAAPARKAGSMRQQRF